MKSITNRALLAALAFGLASGPVSAVINLSDTDTTNDSYKYARETLPSTSSLSVDGTAHYLLRASNTDLDISFAAGVGINTADTGLVRVTLTGMAFAGGATDEAALGGDGAWGRVSGGMKGDTTALFRSTASVGSTANLVLSFSAPTGEDAVYLTAAHKGGVVIEVINVTLEGALGEGTARKKYTAEGVIVGSPFIMSKVTGKDATATVDSGFMGFSTDGSVKTAALGTVHVAASTTALENAAPTTLGDDAARADVYTGGTLKLKGDFSFVQAVSAQSGTNSATCGADAGTTTVLNIADDKMSAQPGTTGAIGTVFESMNYICLTVKNETVIPATSYTLDIDYTTPLGRVSPLTDVVDAPFGSIKRDGTTINIPFVTTHEKYDQRFMIVNSGAATTYTFMFTPEMGVTATPGMKATGNLPEKKTIVLNATDVVTLTGMTAMSAGGRAATRVAATVAIPSQTTNIEMSTILRSTDSGAMEITVLQPE